MRPGCKHNVLTVHAVLTHTLPSIACRSFAALQGPLRHELSLEEAAVLQTGCPLPLACPVPSSNAAAANSPCLPLACPATPMMPSVRPGLLA